MGFVQTVDTALSVLAAVGIPVAVALFALLFTGKGTAVHKQVSRQGLVLAAIVAVVATLGSLFYSEIAHFTPCKLCWLQRICAYPLALILPIAAARRDRQVWRYALPLVVVGAAIATYHYVLQMVRYTGFCVADSVDCAQSYMFFAGFVSIPLMALVAFVLVAGFLLVARSDK